MSATKNLAIAYWYCCRVWPILLGYPVRHCKLCGSMDYRPATDEEIAKYKQERGIN